MSDRQDSDNRLLLKLQQGIPLVSHPFAVLGETLGLNEKQVVARINSFFDQGKARRMGGVFDARRLGYRSMLCAVDLPEEAVNRLTPVLVAHPGITHCYERSWPAELPESLPGGPMGHEHVPNVWFTLAVNWQAFDREVDALSTALAPYEILKLPALRRFKIDVIFDPRHRKRSEEFPGMVAAKGEVSAEEFPAFAEQEKAIVRILDNNMPRVVNPFEVIAGDVGIALDELLIILNKWKSCGVLRRLAMIVYHHKLGFKANGMCVWPVDEASINEAGRILAACQEVTHCYQRPKTKIFPYDLYAMIHDQSWQKVHQLFLNISEKTGLVNGRFLCSTREFKKTSMSYFSI